MHSQKIVCSLSSILLRFPESRIFPVTVCSVTVGLTPSFLTPITASFLLLEILVVSLVTGVLSR